MKKKVLGLLTLATVATFALAACGSGSKDSGKDSGKDKGGEAQTEDVTKFPIAVNNDADAIEGGTLEVAVVMDTPFKGVFSEVLYEDNYDATFMYPSHEALFQKDNDFNLTDEGAATLTFDQAAKTANIKLNEGVTWSDGEAVIAEDLIYSYEVIGSKDYTGVRYDDNFTNIVGMDEYHDGKADTISGIKEISDKEIQVTYKEVNPGMLQLDGGVYTIAVPKHAWKDIPIKDLESSDVVRKTPITFGPYVMTKIKSGEFVEYTPNEYYYKGKPKLDKVILTAVPSASIAEALKAKKYDMALSMPTDNFDSYKKTDGYQILGRQELAYTYLGFKQGTFDKDKGEVVMNPDAKMADPALRQAMGYAIDNDAIGKKFYSGLRTAGTTLIPPLYETLHNTEVKGYHLDHDKANKLLDDAGYEDKDGDGFRETPKGEELTINFASMSGGETAQPIADYYIQQWKEIGIKVELTTGRLIDFQAFYDKLKEDDEEVDIFQAAWGLSESPSPAGLYSRNAQFNYTRFATEENDKLLKAIDSEESFDDAKKKEAYDAWQEYMFDQAFVIPTLYRYQVLPINDRVKNFDWSYGTAAPWFDIELTADSRK